MNREIETRIRHWVYDHGQVSPSFLQRKLKISFEEALELCRKSEFLWKNEKCKLGKI